MAATAILRRHRGRMTMTLVDAAFDDRDVTAILSGIFDMNANLTRIADDISVIRMLLEDGDEEEEAEEEGDGPLA